MARFLPQRQGRQASAAKAALMDDDDDGNAMAMEYPCSKFEFWAGLNAGWEGRQLRANKM